MKNARKFNLLGFFSVSSFILVLLIGASIVYISRQMLTTQLVESGESANVALANSLANAMWPSYAAYVTNVDSTDAEALRARPETALIHRDLARLVQGLPVLKVKIYNTDAITIYSSEMAQIGESKADNAGYLTSLRARVPASKLSRRGSFSAFSGQVSNVSLVETYVPIVNRQTNRLESVFELYSDVSAFTDRIDRTLVNLGYILAALLILLYLAQFYAIRWANRTIEHQRRELERHQSLLESANNAMQKEIYERMDAEKQLAASQPGAENTRVLPLVVKMCGNIAREYLRVAGSDRTDEVRKAYNSWRKNRIRGPSSINIFISLLSRNLEGQTQLDFESRAQNCLKLWPS